MDYTILKKFNSKEEFVEAIDEEWWNFLKHEGLDDPLSLWHSVRHEVLEPPKDCVKQTVGPICVVVNNRIYYEKAEAQVIGNTAYITDEQYQYLF